jgi:hypothetical protein
MRRLRSLECDDQDDEVERDDCREERDRLEDEEDR